MVNDDLESRNDDDDDDDDDDKEKPDCLCMY